MTPSPDSREARAQFLLVKRGLYYGPDNRGYTGIKERAGRYHEADADELSGVSAIHEDAAPMFSPACWNDVKVEYLLAQIADRDRRLAAAEQQRIVHGEGWRDIVSAPKDGTIIWALINPRLYPDVRPERPDLERWNGVQVPVRHPGIVDYDDGPFDMGWNVAAPVGTGGFPDDWFVGWMPLPALSPDTVQTKDSSFSLIGEGLE